MNDTNKQVIKFNEISEPAAPITSKNIFIIPSDTSLHEGNHNVVLEDIIDHCWLDQYYTGDKFSVHIGGEYICYGVKSNKSNLIKIVNIKTGFKSSIHLVNGPARDFQFAYIVSSIFVAVLDGIGNILIYRVLNNTFHNMLDVERYFQILQKDSHAISTIAWCPFTQENLHGNAYYYSRILAISCGNEVMLWNIDEARHHPDRIINFDSELVTIKCNNVITEVVYSPVGYVIAVVCLDGVVQFYQVDIDVKSYNKLLHEWIPHNGEPVTMLYFFDSLKKDMPEKYWRYVVTATKDNTEIKIWSCGDWSLLYAVNFEQKTSIPRKLQSHLDPNSHLFFLHNQVDQHLYVFRFLDEDTLRLHHIVEFRLPFSLQNYAVFNAKLDVAVSATANSVSNRVRSNAVTFIIVYSSYVRYFTISYEFGKQATVDNRINNKSNEHSSKVNNAEERNQLGNNFTLSTYRTKESNTHIQDQQKKYCSSKEYEQSRITKSKDVEKYYTRFKNDHKNGYDCSIMIDKLENLMDEVDQLKSLLFDQDKSLNLLRRIISGNCNEIKKRVDHAGNVSLLRKDAEVTSKIIRSAAVAAITTKLVDSKIIPHVKRATKEGQDNCIWEMNSKIDTWQTTLSVHAKNAIQPSNLKTVRIGSEPLFPYVNSVLFGSFSGAIFRVYEYLENFLYMVTQHFDVMKDFREEYDVTEFADNVNKRLEFIFTKIKDADEAVYSMKRDIREITRSSTIEQMSLLDGYRRHDSSIGDTSSTMPTRESFLKTLADGSTGTLIRICQELDFEYLFSCNPKIIQQHNIVTLLQRVSCELAIKTELKLSLMEKTIVQIETNHTATKNQLPAILSYVKNNASIFISNYSLNPDKLARFKVVIMALNSLMNSLDV